MYIYQPYVYIIRWTNANKGYIGVRYANGCHPSDLFKTYHTSSKLVCQVISEFGLPDKIKIFPCPDRDIAILKEERFQRRFDVLNSEYWLNMNIRGLDFVRINQKHSDESKIKMSKAHKGKVLSDIHKSNLVIARKNRIIPPHTEESKRKISKAHKGKIISKETKIKMSLAKRKTETYTFRNKDGTTFSGTCFDFYNKYGLSSSRVYNMINGTRKSHKGWKLI